MKIRKDFSKKKKNSRKKSNKKCNNQYNLTGKLVRNKYKPNSKRIMIDQFWLCQN